MTLLTRRQITPNTTFLKVVQVANGTKFKAPYCLELKLRSASKLSVSLISSLGAAPTHTVALESKMPGWVVFHFLIGPMAMTGVTLLGDFSIEINNLNSGQQIVIEEGLLTYGADMVTPNLSFQSGLCKSTSTIEECLKILKGEVNATRSLVATVPYLLEWESLLFQRFGKSSNKWSQDSRDEFEKFVVDITDELTDLFNEELLKRLMKDKVVEAIIASMRKLIPELLLGLLPWIERLSAYGLLFHAFTPSFTATEHQMAVLSGEVALLTPFRERLLEQSPILHQKISDTIVKPMQTIIPTP